MQFGPPTGICNRALTYFGHASYSPSTWAVVVHSVENKGLCWWKAVKCSALEGRIDNLGFEICRKRGCVVVLLLELYIYIYRNYGNLPSLVLTKKFHSLILEAKSCGEDWNLVLSLWILLKIKIKIKTKTKARWFHQTKRNKHIKNSEESITNKISSSSMHAESDRSR